MHTQTDRQTQRHMHAGGTLHSPWQNDSLKDQCGCYLFLGHCVCVHVCVFNISRALYSVSDRVSIYLADPTVRLDQ